ncbi:hypothetical protein [Mycobacterium sp. NAZ190054]|uniref:hypothetical protein n=1 Tax=Mycobacterium sp. NAZ190054 TaxID=1747766 RepID=UPI00079628A9|nr:hypothetical protein [Mycobacterium sp. NAZ190054]KWX66847.1 hypothetical protein ASJ79_05635 [Mycobacterium sp. NAZ190054]
MIASVLRFPLAVVGTVVDRLLAASDRSAQRFAAVCEPTQDWERDHSDPAASATADPLPTPEGDTDPAAGIPASAAGSPNGLAGLIDGVLAEHVGPEWWIDTVSRGVAERIEKATPPAPFTFGDLAEAARIVRNHATRTTTTWSEHGRLIALANRLDDAADADPNP